MKAITVVDYDPNWQKEFEKIKAELNAILGDCILAIEHVGSTSVPQLYAKPIIDIDIVIENNMFNTVAQKLAVAAYIHQGDLGIIGREAFRYDDKTHLMEHNLYVCAENADELKRHKALRDFLRENVEYREKYSNIKIEMAKKHPYDIEAYLNGKQPVIMEIYGLCGLDNTYKG